MPGTEERGKKRTYISVSSSSSSGDNDEEEDESEGEWGSESESEEYDGNDEDYDEEEETGISTSSNDDVEDDDGENNWSDEKDELDDQEDEKSPDIGCDESFCNNVIRLLREKSDLQGLNLRECKSYLRQHGLRITGTKAECIQRIMEHWRIKEGNAEVLYPRSSFVINCTGDVCKGDVALFTQKVYKKFDKVTRRGSLLGNRTIAGKVVKESYGAKKQQHTFTIEVLWSKGIKTLPPLFPLLVKGRNLYKLKTFRQCWNNEKERQEVLAEKHKRGAAARLVRATAKRRRASLKNRDMDRSGGPAKLCPHPPQKFLQSHTHLHHRHHWRSAPFCFPPYGPGSTSATRRFLHFRPHMDSSVVPVSQSHGYNHVSYPPGAFSYPSGVLEPSNFDSIQGQSNPFSYGKETYGKRRGL